MIDRVLVIGPSWVGDMVVAQSLFKTLKATRESVSIDVLAPNWNIDLVKAMPEVDQAIPLACGHGELGLAKRYRLAKLLRGRYQQAIIIPRSFKAALIPAFAGIKRRTSSLGEMRYGLINDIRDLNKQKFPRLQQRYQQLAKLDETTNINEDLLPEFHLSVQQIAETKKKLGINDHDKVLALCPGAEFGPAKQWPAEHCAAVADYAVQNGFTVWILGSPKDNAIAEEIQKQCPHTLINYCGKTSLIDAMVLLHLASAVLSNDSGLMHIAAALQKPLVAVYGSSDPNYTPPISKTAKVLSLNLDCSPCFQRQCPLEHLDCLRKLMPEQVITALSEQGVC